MKPVTPFDNFPSFGNAGSRQAPGDAKYALGFVAADTLPAEWANYFFHGSTKGISDLNTAVRSIWLELSSVLTAYNITADASVTNQLYTAIEKRISSLYPIGTVYQNADSNKNPGDSDMLGFGTWIQITDAFLASRGSSHIGANGGAWSKQLTSAEIPQHTHGMQHYHYTNINHGHGVTDPGHNHHIGPDGNPNFFMIWQNGEATAVSGWPRVAALFSETVNGNIVYASRDTTGISVNGTGDLQKFSSGALANDQWAGRTETDAYGTANPTAISLIPTYVGVYTWKRTA